jgi:hypothetical protein
MAQKENIIVSVGTEFDGKALAKAEKKLSDFEKTALKAGKVFAGVFAAQKIAAFGKSAVNEFIQSEKAAKSLGQTLTNIGQAYKSPAIDMYLKKLSLQYGIVDDELVPAYNSLLLSTRDTAQAQGILQTALDVSAGTGKDLQSVVAALSKAYVGNNTALQKLGIGLSKAQLSGAKFADLQKELNSLFAGQAAYAAQGYTGDIQKLTVAWDQFKESVGEGILKGLDTTNIDKLTASLVSLGNALGVVIGGLSGFLSYTFEGLSHPTLFLPKKAPGVPDAGSDRGGAAKAADQRAEALAKLQAKTAAAQTVAAKASTAAAKAQLLLSKAGSVLDVQQAEIYAALQNKITDNEKLRLELELALLTKNGDAAYSLSQQLLVSQLKTTELATTIANLPKALNPFADWPKYIQDLIAQMALLQKAIPGAPTVTPTTTTQNPYDAMFEKLKQQNIAMGIEPGAAAGLAASSSRLQAEADAYFKAHPEIDPMTGAIRSGFAGSAQATGASYTFNIDANNTIDPNSITKAVQDAILIINRNGYSTVPAGQGF